MGADQQFCLRWNNFHSNITSAFESLRDDEDFVDITLACEGRQIKAHKMVLSACSPYFRSLLKGNPCQHPIVFLKDVTFANLTSILDFMYHGEVNVSHNELATFLKTAEALKVRGLAEDEKKKDAEGYNESSSPPPSRGEPPDPGSSPRPEEGGSAPDTHLSGDSPQPPPSKRQRRRSAASLHSAEDNTSETVLSEGQRDSSASVKNEPQDYPEDEDNMLASSAPATLEPQDLIKADLEDPDDRSFGPSDSVTISRSQAAMQQLQESFGSFLPGMGQAPSGFLPQGATDLPRPPPYPLEGVQGLPPGISALPGPSMSQGASQETGQGAAAGQQRCPLCHKSLSRWTSLRRHIEDKHTQGGAHVCPICFHVYRTKNSLHNHLSVYHRGATGSRGRRGRYPSYTVLRPATAHQLAELKAAARRRDLSLAVAAPDLPGPGPVPVSAPVPMPAHAAPPALAPVLPEEPGVAGHSTAGGFEALLQSDAEAGGALHPTPCKSSAASPQGLASPKAVDE
ncbi:broad-complex core protein isoforms 1/2/3/4/5-like isoform X1 [Eriocheir sinensis]|uniref:broad-complex core protein isoforms 1/2/3/4/5-like isoform X1 n=1 Tax=Eriocheir sinensis TaxID=95602 RepID=UPI0021CA4CED|nr:broad-complex core protein isoforms 1/2/3/4/5-like isoform X1 [Eriocheir sinensis]XP_050739815.1 broad-complex core protein isoforms 1/2/3/4/5-like isoform X1 [Eriocheir sinensis]XP_050739816.1 broad-complex core protein isoforms 1/2/3/4/5-like isoform X1 [Eriocheir sinensis]